MPQKEQLQLVISAQEILLLHTGSIIARDASMIYARIVEIQE